jgi:hypothetical protein
MICEETDPLYASRPAAIEAAAACIAVDNAVFLTRDCLFSTGGATTSWLVRTGRFAGAFEGIEEVSDFVLSVVVGRAGWFVGRLETVFTTRCRSCAAPDGTKTKLINNAQNDRYEIFFKLFKTGTPNFYY